jgi:adenylate cyclase
MGTEIERKYLVVGDSWRAEAVASTRIVQGYLASTDRCTVRVRVKGEKAFITVKGSTRGISRSEFEYLVPVDDAQAMLDEMAQGPVIDKVRHRIPVGEHEWELDVFAGANAGLVMAEVELSDPTESFELPTWVGAEVSDDPRYYNVNLATNPYSQWGAV